MKDSVTDNNNFQFISEKPKDGNLLFGHKEIVTTLEKVILKSPESFTIGLYGDWGSGKSSIAETLQSNLKNRHIPLVIFDVWKHEGDALRRTFLKELNKKLESSYFGKNYYKEKFILDKNIDSTIKSDISDGYKVEWKKMFKHVALIVLFFSVIVFSVFGLFWIASKLFSFDTDPSSKILETITLFVGGISVPIIYWFKYFNSFIKEKKEQFIKSQFQDPIEFERSFHRILKNLTDNVSKIVIVFDNLDRVNGEKAIQIMSTIKTFLDPVDKSIEDKNVVFVVPCDEAAIKRHLRETLNYSNSFKGDNYHRYAGEYLRKFFNTIIWIPEFYINELEELAKEKLQDTQISDFKNDELSALIVLVFDKNPRQIIQFINILISNYLLIKERPIEGFSLKEDIAKLAKYLLLIQKFPDIMDIYKLTLSYDLESLPTSLNDEIEGGRSFSQKRISEFYSFLRLTEHVKIDSLDLFFKLRRSDFEMKLENSVRLIKLLETNRIREIIKLDKSASDKENDKSILNDLEFLKKFKLENKQHELSEIVMEKMRKMTNPILLAKFIDGLLNLIEFKKIEIDKRVHSMIYKKLSQHGTNLSEINPKLIIELCYNNLTLNNEKQGFKKLINDSHIEDFSNF